ncbi:hypothetical protein AB6A40_010882 [Gnathostoma spinigerum]|uniref:Uncharacterized protein n=1 Tax=Gnathostoma spinigerum TaxID=75299 RepID=A0ABD6EW52_9BILA
MEDLFTDSYAEWNRLLFYEGRLATFDKSWPHKEENLSPANLAKAGFFFCPDRLDRDNVKCPFCFKCLCNWEPGDDPL